MNDTILPRPSLVHRRLADNRPVYCFKCNIHHPMVVEMLALAGAQCLWLDTEHFATSIQTMSRLVQAARGAGVDAIVRVPNGHYADAARMLDSGANGIMYPRVRGPEDVRKLVEATRFAPLGQRGADFGTAAACYGLTPPQEVLRQQNEQSQLVVQIETPEAVERIDEIATVPGISMLFIGPGDLSITMGRPCDPDEPHIRQAMERTAAAAAGHGLHWGMPVTNAEHARRVLDMGGRFLAQGGDSVTLIKAVRAMRDDIASVADAYGGFTSP